MTDNPYSVRTRERRGYLKEAQGYTGWTEVQVVGRRGRVLARFDFVEQALAWIERKRAEDAAR
jgi:viroplasmin and RNaseH domain-containing protein